MAGFSGDNVRGGFKVDTLLKMIEEATVQAKNKLEKMGANRSSISIAEMFEMQMLMNNLSQLAEMGGSVVSAAHTAVASMARNVKG